MKYIQIIVIQVLFLIFLFSCGDQSQYDPPVDHTSSQNGYMHSPGLRDPNTNCVSCHGADLQGGEPQTGESGVSCFECHGKEW